MSQKAKASSRTASRQQRNPKSQPGYKIAFQFVNVLPNDHDLKTKVQTRSFIRENAAHFHWRHNRPPKHTCKPKKQQPIARSSSPPSTKHSSKALNHSAAIGIGHPQVSDSYHDKRSSSYHYHQIEKNAELGFNVDPFPSYDSELPRDLVSRCIIFNARAILPVLFPDGGSNLNIRTSMLQLSLSDPCMLHVFVVGALMNSQRALGFIDIPPSIHDHLSRSRARIVRKLSVSMKDPVEACKDINIYSVAALAKDGQFMKANMPPKLPKQGPLRDLQCLSSFAKVDFVTVHFEGLAMLVELKGGLEKIEMPGIAALISFGGLRVATRNLTAPRFPVVTLSYPPDQFVFEHQEFRFDTDVDIHRVLSMLKSYTAMMDDFCAGRNVMSASVLIDHRNNAQHALLSLPPRGGTAECYRLTALIYSLLVTFPLPYNASPLSSLVTQLKTALAAWHDGDEILLWALTIGGIAAIGLEERDWFTNSFRRAVSRIGVGSWDEAREIIKRGLWLGATNDGDGYDLWHESQT